jgi:hypothetical protein
MPGDRSNTGHGRPVLEDLTPDTGDLTVDGRDLTPDTTGPNTGHGRRPNSQEELSLELSVELSERARSQKKSETEKSENENAARDPSGNAFTPDDDPNRDDGNLTDDSSGDAFTRDERIRKELTSRLMSALRANRTPIRDDDALRGECDAAVRRALANVADGFVFGDGFVLGVENVAQFIAEIRSDPRAMDPSALDQKMR